MRMIAIEAQTKAAARNSSVGPVEHYRPETALRIEQSVAYMTQHLDRPLQVATLAAQANISSSHFFALFKRRIGSAPMDYFTRLRMQRATLASKRKASPNLPVARRHFAECQGDCLRAGLR